MNNPRNAMYSEESKDVQTQVTYEYRYQWNEEQDLWEVYQIVPKIGMILVGRIYEMPAMDFEDPEWYWETLNDDGYTATEPEARVDLEASLLKSTSQR